MTMRRPVPPPATSFQQSAPNFGSAGVPCALDRARFPAQNAAAHQSMQAPTRGPPAAVPNAKPSSFPLSAAVGPAPVREQASPQPQTSNRIGGPPPQGSQMPLGGQTPIVVGRGASPSKRQPSKEAADEQRRAAAESSAPARLTTPGASSGVSGPKLAAAGPAPGAGLLRAAPTPGESVPRPAPTPGEGGMGGYLLPARPATKAQPSERTPTPSGRTEALPQLDRPVTPLRPAGHESDRSGRGAPSLSNQMSENILASRAAAGSDDYSLKANASAAAIPYMQTLHQSPAAATDLDACTRNVPTPGSQSGGANLETNSNRVRELEQLNAELERRLDEDGKQFLEALTSLESEVEQLTKQNKALVEEQHKQEEQLRNQGSDGELRAQNLRMERERQDMLQQLDEFETEKEEDIRQATEETERLQQKLAEQERKLGLRIVDLERERDNTLQAMTDEGQELSGRIEKLNRDKESLSLDLAKALARADVAATASSDPPRSGMSLNNSNLTEASSQLRSVIQERETLKDEVTTKDGELLILRNQVKIAEKKLRLTDMENSRLKSEYEVLQRSMDKGAASPTPTKAGTSSPMHMPQQVSPAPVVMASRAEAAIPTTRSPRCSGSPTIIRAPIVNGLR